MRQFINIVEGANISNREPMYELTKKLKILLDNGYDIDRIVAELKKAGHEVRIVTKDEIETLVADEPLAEGWKEVAGDVAMRVMNGIAVLFSVALAGVSMVVIGSGPIIAAGAGMMIAVASVGAACVTLGALIAGGVATVTSPMLDQEFDKIRDARARRDAARAKRGY